MSRGLGELQQAIYRELKSSDNPLTTEYLRWTIYEKLGKKPLHSGDLLPKSWSTSFARAVSGLLNRGIVSLECRPLKNFKECVINYPSKTHSVGARSLRLELLPILEQRLRGSAGGVHLKYRQADNELYHLNLLEADGKVADLKRRWSQLEPLLSKLYGETGRDSLLRLICKGRSLFRGCEDIVVDMSFEQLVDEACDGSLLSKCLQDRLTVFLRRFISGARVMELKFVSSIHTFTHVPQLGQCSLRDETLEYLHANAKERVEAMDGFSVEEKRPQSLYPLSPRKYQYSDRLKRLFDHTVFQEFNFLTLRRE